VEMRESILFYHYYLNQSSSCLALLIYPISAAMYNVDNHRCNRDNGTNDAPYRPSPDSKRSKKKKIDDALSESYLQCILHDTITVAIFGSNVLPEIDQSIYYQNVVAMLSLKRSSKFRHWLSLHRVLDTRTN